MSDRVRVVYVAGAGRSGTTLLAMLLGALPGVMTLGETRHLWARGVRDDELCSCGAHFHACPFWTEVGERAYGGWDTRRAERMLELQRQVDRFRTVPRMLARGRPAAPAAAVDEYMAAFLHLYQAAREVSGGILVDSSKAPSYLGLLQRRRDVDVRVVHLVRDSRAVVHSWARLRFRPDSGSGGAEHMALIGPRRSTADWLANNLAIDLLNARDRTASLIRYEELVTEPAAAIQRMLGPWLAQPAALAALAAGGPIDIGTQHVVAGNPMRFQTEELRLKPDYEWRAAMPRSRRLAVGAATWPLLLRYGYRPGAGRA
ncbi:MAG TPA: sulfotransferase [Thermoleophilia bacterium]|nr:sulfotransferase [Thermoleophilia bacterium]